MYKTYIETHRVRYNECDQLGMVFNANYLVYADIAVTGYWREYLGGYKSLNDSGLDLVVVNAQIQFLKPLRDEQVFQIITEVQQIGTSSVKSAFTIESNGEDHCLIDMTHVCVQTDSSTPVRVPDWVRSKLSL